MTHRALYYPHLPIYDPEFLFESLLYWDRVACIAPKESHTLYDQRYDVDPEVWRAMATLGEAYLDVRVPTASEKDAVHERLRTLAERPAPEWCRPENLTDETAGFLWLQKIGDNTLEMLTRSGWMRPEAGSETALISSAAANVILAALAEECSSPTLPPVTDDLSAFRASCNTLLFELDAGNGLSGPALDIVGSAPKEDDTALILLSVRKLGIDPGQVSASNLRKLAKLREDDGFNGQREAFCAQIDKYIDELRAAPEGEGDHRQ